MGQLKVKDIMTAQVVTLSGDDTVKDATIKLAVDNVSGAPVVDDDYRLIGILSENDILGLIVKYDKKYNFSDGSLHMLALHMDSATDDPAMKKASAEISETKVSQIMTRTVLTTSPESSIMDVLKSMINMDVNRVPVLEKGVLVGIVTRGDIIFSIYKKKI
jgi:CBS domain-containing protein